MITQSKSPTLAKEGFVKVLDKDKKDTYIQVSELVCGEKTFNELFTEISMSIDVLNKKIDEYIEDSTNAINNLYNDHNKQLTEIYELKQKITELSQFSFGD